MVEPLEITGVLTIGLFDAIGALRMAADALGWNVVGHVNVEKSKATSRVVEHHFPGSILVDDVTKVDVNMVKEWSQRFTQVALVVVGAAAALPGC